jgi:HK97 family phage major capsid protein
VEVSNELLEDAAFAIDTLLTRLFRLSMAARHERNIIRGTGVAEPLGILNSSAAVGVAVDTDNAFVLADALEMLTRFRSVGGAPVWIIHSSVWAEIGAMQTSAGGQGFINNLGDGLGTRLLGYPIVVSEHMPGKISGTGYDRAILADLSAYLWFQRRDISIAFSEHAAFTTGKGTFRFDQRVDGKPWLRTAITDANPQGSFTVSPFVYLND